MTTEWKNINLRPRTTLLVNSQKTHTHTHTQRYACTTWPFIPQSSRLRVKLQAKTFIDHADECFLEVSRTTRRGYYDQWLWPQSYPISIINNKITNPG